MEAVKTNIVETIQKNPVVVYAKNGCPYCTRTKKRFEELGVTVHWEDITNRTEYQDVLNSSKLFGEAAALKTQYGLILKKHQRTVPNIWIGKEQVGGSDDLELLSDEVVKQKVEAAGAL